MVERNTMVRLILVSVLGILPMMQMAGASGLGWVLYGKVVDGGTCAPLVGAVVSSPYNSNASIATNASGGYRLVLGTGAWNVTYSYTGYNSAEYSAPYETSGAFLYNASLLKPGEVASSNCLTGAQPSPGNNATSSTTTITGSTTTISTPGSSSSTTSTQPSAPPASSALNTAYIIAGVVIVIIIIAIAYFAMRGKKK